MKHFVKEWLYRHDKPGNQQVFSLARKDHVVCVSLISLPLETKSLDSYSAETASETLDFVT